MSAPVPPHYTAFRIVLLVTICLAFIAGLWWIVDGNLLRLLGVR